MDCQRIGFMLSMRNIYALLLICVIHLGCSSSYRYQMDRGDSESVASSSMGRLPHGTSGDMVDVSVLDEKVNKFLETGRFKRGSSISDYEIDLVIKKLGRSVDIFSVDLLEKGYREFLNKYGSICGKGFRICGPTRRVTDQEEKVYDLASMQLGFENSCRINEVKDGKEKSCWLIAEIGQDDQYYINLSTGINKDYIYSMDRNGRSKIFAENFLDFLDKFFESYDRKDKEKSYEEGFYK